jgi:hypothetical protein
MLRTLLPRLSFSKIIAMLAVFIAVGSVAYASGYVDSSGTIHGCVSKSGQLTLVKSGSHCSKGTRISWGQKGPAGQKGPIGSTGPQGPQGPGAISFNKHVDAPGAFFFVQGGVAVSDSCYTSGISVQIAPEDASGQLPVYVSGDEAIDGTLQSVQVSSPTAVGPTAKSTANLDVIATTNGTYSRFDLGGFTDGSACNFWGLVTPGVNDPNI